MANDRLGVPLSPAGLSPVKNSAGANEPGLNWKMSQPALRQIEQIEANLRTAEQRTGSVILR